MRRILLLLSLLGGYALASHYTGTYRAGSATLTIQQDSSGYMVGQLSDGQNVFDMEGEAFGDMPGQGIFYNARETLAFEAQLSPDGNRLTLGIVALNPAGQALPQTYQEVIFIRSAATSSHDHSAADVREASPEESDETADEASETPEDSLEDDSDDSADDPVDDSADDLADDSADDPADETAEDNSESRNPLATRASPLETPYAGVFLNDELRLELHPDADGYSGDLHFGGQRFPISGSLENDTLTGNFESDGTPFPFRATLEGDSLSFTTEGASYLLTREGAPAEEDAEETAPDPTPPLNPLDPPGNPLDRAANPLERATNPLEPSDPYVGLFANDDLRLELRRDGDSYSGEVQLGEQSFSLSATLEDDSLAGNFESNGTSFPFTALLEGDSLTFTTGSAIYLLERQAD